MNKKKIDSEKVKDVSPEERAAAWETYVRAEVNRVLDIYLPESVTGTIGIEYVRPILRIDAKSGKQVLDEKKAKGVSVTVLFEFADTVEFFDEVPDDVGNH
jgi:hypothetical protein